MPIKPYLAIAMGTTTVLGGGATIITLNYLNTTSIEKEIINSNRTILTQNANTWNIKLSTYNSELRLEVQLTSEDEARLKKWCEITLKANFKSVNDKNYLNAKKLCTTPTNKEKLLHSKKKLAGDTNWTSKLDEYNKTQTNTNPILGIEKVSAISGQIKNWCEKTLEVEINNDYSLAEKWCTID